MSDHKQYEASSSLPSPVQNAALKLSTHKRPLTEVFVWIKDEDALTLAGDIKTAIWSMFASQLAAFDELADHLEKNTSPFVYCVDSYHRARYAKSKVGKSEKRKLILDVVATTAVEYSVNCIQNPELFTSQGQRIAAPTSQLQKVLTRAENSLVQDDFLELMVKQILVTNDGDVESLTGVFAPVLMALYTSNMSQNDFKQAANTVRPLQKLANVKLLRSIFTNLACWLPTNTISGQEVQQFTFLGPLFRFSLCPRAGGQHEADLYFADIDSQTLDEKVKENLADIRKSISVYQSSLYKLSRALVADSQGKSMVLDWFSAIMKANKKKTQMHLTVAETTSLSDDGFLLNVCLVLLKLGRMDSKPPAFSDIESSYLDRADARVTAAGETLLGGVDSQPPTVVKQQATFVTETFFLTLRCLHIGLIPIIAKYQHEYHSPYSEYQQYVHELTRLERAVDLKEFERVLLPQLQHFVQKQTKKMLCSMVHLHDASFAHPLLSFYAYVCSWLLHLAQGGKGQNEICEIVPNEFACLPEHIVEGLADCLLFIAQLVPEHIDNESSRVWDPIARFMAVFVGNRDYIKNPYVTSKFVEVLHYFTPEKRKTDLILVSSLEDNVKPQQASPFFNAVLQNDTAVAQLGPALLHFFTNVQGTDSYSRNSKRYHVAIILKNLWLSQPHRETLKRESHTDAEFSRFSMLLINDTVDFFDEGRESLKKVIAYQAEVAGDAFSQLSEEEQQATNSSMRQERAHARNSFHFANEAINLFEILTSEIVKPFLEPELVQRVAYLLDFNLVDLIEVSTNEDETSKKLLKLYEEVALKPSDTILALIRVYLNVSQNHDSCEDSSSNTNSCEADSKTVTSDSGVARRISGTPLSINEFGSMNDEFINAVVNDGRSFKPTLFQKFVDIFKDTPPTTLTNDVKTIETVSERFIILIANFEQVAAQTAEAEEDLGEIPDDYLDPILATLMVDPVKLPASGMIVDRAMIRAHLLSDAIDPFNRAPLKIEEVIPQPKLQQEIEQWVCDQKNIAAEKRNSVKQT